MTTMSIGDGANDVAMIKAAQIGVGIAGKEGLHACNNADITLPAFGFLKRVIFCYGRYAHVRNQELFEYCIEKNSILGFIHIVFSFYNLFTVQTVIDSLLLLMFNMFLTLFPIFFQAMTEMDVDMDALEKNPQLYKGMDLKYRPTGLFLFLRMCRTVYYSIVIITLPRYLNQNSMTFANGTV